MNTLKLFNSIRVEEKISNNPAILEKTVSYGFVIDESVAKIAEDELIEKIKSFYLSTSKANQAFHKSWQTIKDTPQEELWLQAIIHYFTTYGYEQLGINGEIYIPNERLDIPNDISLIKISGLTDDEIITKIYDLSGGIALSEDTLNSLIEIIEEYKYIIDIEKVKNRELKSALYDLYDIVPQDPAEFLRFVISRVTGKTLLIKNQSFIEEIKTANSQIQRRELDRLISKAPDNLAEIFFRYKPLFLALKSISANKTFFNQLRKNANRLHKPLKEDYLNSVTSRIKNSKDLSELEDRLKDASVFRKIRLANTLKFRLTSPENIVYKIRNGRSWVSDFIATNPSQTQEALNIVLGSIKVDKTVYIPEGIDYGLPASEKQFIGNLPANTMIKVSDNLIVGVHWNNVDHNRIDLDFSAASLDGKIGWDSNYRSENSKVMFSGDMTDAENGASELLYFGVDNQKTYALFLNYYNFDEDIPVSAKIFVAHEKPQNFSKDYVANNIMIQADFTVKEKQMFLGIVYGNSLYLSASAIGKSITSGGDLVQKSRDYLLRSTTSAIKISDVLNVVYEKGNYPDLSPENIDKSSIIKLLTD